MLNRKLPIVGKSFQELGLLGRVSYVFSAIAAIVAGVTAIWTVFGWAGDQVSLAEKTALWEAQSALYIELSITEKDSPRYTIVKERIKILENALKD